MDQLKLNAKIAYNSRSSSSLKTLFSVLMHVSTKRRRFPKKKPKKNKQKLPNQIVSPNAFHWLSYHQKVEKAVKNWIYDLFICFCAIQYDSAMS